MRPSTASVGGQHTCFIEPEKTIFMYPLQPLTGETLRSATANIEDGAHVETFLLQNSEEVNIRRHFLMLLLLTRCTRAKCA